jgi:hypothetical protein
MKAALAVVLTVWMGLATRAAAEPAAASLCRPGEEIAFSCSLGDSGVSLCTSTAAGMVQSLTYRRGVRDRVAQEFIASAQTGQRFHASVSPVSPRALVRQVWFEQNGRRYVLTECVGGDCSYSAGLGVFQGDRLLSRRRCQRTQDDKAWFARALVAFGSEPASSRSHTELLLIDEVGSAVEKLYLPRRR